VNDIVLVAGAGPVGLAAAVRLRQLGVRVRVLERRAALNAASRASTFHSPTLEFFDQLGITPDIGERGHRVDAIHYYDRAGGLFAAFPLRLLERDTRFPYRLHLEQSEVAAILARRLGDAVALDSEVTGVVSDATGVSVEIRAADGAMRWERGAYLIAADGARGGVRERLGIAFEGQDYDDRVLRVMTVEDLGRRVPGLASIAYIFDGAASCSLLRMPDLWRIIFRVPPEESDAAALEPARIAARLGRFLPDGASIPVASTDIYRVSRRVAARYREGRVLLAGDAAHVTNTRGGMNMNAGLHDARAAADAVVAALGGEAEALDRYASVRRRVAVEQLIPRTDRVVAGGRDWLDGVRETARDPARARNFLLATSMLDMIEG